MTNAVAAKGVPKSQTVNLKVYIHCEGCKKKVTKTLKGIDGVESVVVDSNLGKATVTGTADAKTLIKKLEKAGKYAELLATPQPAAKVQQKEVKETKENQGGNSQENSSSAGKNKGGNNAAGGNGESGGTGGGGGSDKNGGGKQKGAFNIAGAGGGDGVGENTPKAVIAQKNVAPTPSRITVQSDSSLESADHVVHMFSDENANNCSVM